MVEQEAKLEAFNKEKVASELLNADETINCSEGTVAVSGNIFSVLRANDKLAKIKQYFLLNI